MKIVVDSEGRAIVEQLVDIALKHGGLANFNSVTKILSVLKNVEEDQEKKEKKK